MSVHPYRQTNPETVAEDYPKLRLLIAQYAPRGTGVPPVVPSKAKKDMGETPMLPPIISSEWGYSAGWKKFDEEKQGKYLPRELLTNAWQEIPVSIWYDWHDDGLDAKEPEHHFGTVHHPYLKGEAAVYEPKPAYLAMKTLAKELDGYVFNKRLSIENPQDFILLFNKPGHRGEVKLAVWTTGADHDISLAGIAGQFTGTSLLGKPLDLGNTADAASRLKLTDSVQYLTPHGQNPGLVALANWPRVPLEVFSLEPGSPEPKDLPSLCTTLPGLERFVQHSAAMSMNRLAGSAVPTRGSGAPMSTHFARSATTSGDSFSLGGIFIFS